MLELKVNAQDVVNALDNLATRQLPFALKNAVNRTGLDFQAAERARLASVFTLRRQDFIFKQGVKVLGGFATKQRPSITLGQDSKADFLAKFEPGGEKTSTVGGDIAIPIDVLRDKHDVVPTVLRPKYLFGAVIQRGRLAGFRSSGADVFIVRPGDLSDRTPGIYQRLDGSVQLLYALKTEVPIPALLGFEDLARTVVAERWPINFSEEFLKALANAKSGGEPIDLTPRETAA